MMSTMLFMLLALAMCLCIAAVFIWILLRQRPVRTSASQAKLNASVYRAQISDLDREHQSGHISTQEWQQTRDELSQRLLEDTSVGDDPEARKEKPALWTTVFLAIAFPLASLSFYLWVGEPEALQAMATEPPEKAMQSELTGMAQSLAKKLEANPDNHEGWVMLGRSYRTLEKYDQAASAYDRALKLSADDGLKLERAEVLALKAQGNFDGEPWDVIRDILKKDPQHKGALLLAGSASYAHDKYADALRYWQQARKLMAADHPDVPGLEGAIATVQNKLGLPVTAATTPPPKASTAAASAGVTASASPGGQAGLNVTGRLSLAAALKDKTLPSDLVFVYASPANGDRMPLAIFKSTVAKLPLNFTLDDSTAMLPDRKLSGAGEVILKARISKSGNAIPQSGDLTGSLGPVKVGAKGLILEIKEQIP
jgi:cytochrome c-type biogenesis protein CcmH